MHQSTHELHLWFTRNGTHLAHVFNFIGEILRRCPLVLPHQFQAHYEVTEDIVGIVEDDGKSTGHVLQSPGESSTPLRAAKELAQLLQPLSLLDALIVVEPLCGCTNPPDIPGQFECRPWSLPMHYSTAFEFLPSQKITTVHYFVFILNLNVNGANPSEAATWVNIENEPNWDYDLQNPGDSYKTLYTGFLKFSIALHGRIEIRVIRIFSHITVHSCGRWVPWKQPCVWVSCDQQGTINGEKNFHNEKYGPNPQNNWQPPPPAGGEHSPLCTDTHNACLQTKYDELEDDLED